MGGKIQIPLEVFLDFLMMMCFGFWSVLIVESYPFLSYNAVHVEQIFQIVSFMIIGIFFGDDQIFGFLGTITTLAVIVPLIGTLLLIPVLYITVYPVPPYPINLTPYIFIGIMVIGFVVMLVIQARNPSSLNQESTMLIRTVESATEADLREPQIG